jgi:cytochrome oxidase assembly protein ShyY1
MNYWKNSWKRWLVWTALVALFATACVLLSEWQFHRRAEKLVEISIVQKNYDAPAVPVDQLLKSDRAAEVKWRPVLIEGRYLTDDALLLRNRPLNGQPGFEQIVPFEFEGGLLLIDRGWLPTGSKQDSPDINPMPSNSEQTIVVRLLPSENDSGRSAPDGQLADLNLMKAATITGLPINTKWYGRVAQFEKAPMALPKPAADEGNHLSYAVQWLVFGAMAFAFLAYTIRTEWRFAKGIAPKRKQRRSDRDAAEEDQLLG